MESTKEPVSVAEVHAMVQARLGETVTSLVGFVVQSPQGISWAP
jgi:hypothetical protein